MLDDLRWRNAVHEAGHTAAALTFGIPIVKVTIDEDPPHLHRGRYRADPDFAVEAIVVFCMAGGEAERLFCGEITDDADRMDIAMARQFLAEQFEPLWLGGQLDRMRESARRLVHTPSDRQAKSDPRRRCREVRGVEIVLTGNAHERE